MSIVIVGAGLAGATAVTELREKGYSGEIVLLGAEKHLPYERPPLSKGFLMGEQEFDEALVHDQAWYFDEDVDLRLGMLATRIDLASKVVHAEPVGGGEPLDIPYEQLLLATGATPRVLDMGGGVGPSMTLRTIDDSITLRKSLKPGAHVAIVGGGWIGLEVASAARQAGAEVTVFESGDLPLERVLGPEVATLFADLHRGHGVDLRLGSRPTPADLSGADVIVAAIGVTPNVSLAEEAGLAVDNGVLVDASLRTSDANVFAVGDIANQEHPLLGRRIRVEHWDNAIEQAKIAARNMLGAHEQYDRQPYFFTDQYDLGMEYVGNVGPEGYDHVEIEGPTKVLEGDAFRAFWIRSGTVVAAMHANDWDASDVIRDSIGTAR
ncbi:NAD(P)/FAD-dependent oxidoreductase [Tessaracoccus antarcticus]|uniref:NAD(P)/FAD-dependent oxidoreductase n=1 Tax=Tessaracoccus antarcticus TaxID=2479848 RepID=A0A3M0G921_9ACTN|nr:FAD-dependent oxidoreductase [Tessaracoccus antarcticus]RMB61560.1 NAD(P)/FAD-dependent oxidoreductase [Tessaracoccus antarcticus]